MNTYAISIDLWDLHTVTCYFGRVAVSELYELQFELMKENLFFLGPGPRGGG